MQTESSKRRRTTRRVRGLKRRGLSPLEVVMTTALMFPSIVLTAYLAINLCRALYSIIGTMVGSPVM